MSGATSEMESSLGPHSYLHAFRVFLDINYFGGVYACDVDSHNAMRVKVSCQVIGNHAVYYLYNVHEDAFVSCRYSCYDGFSICGEVSLI